MFISQRNCVKVGLWERQQDAEVDGLWGTRVQGQGELRVAPGGVQREGSRRQLSAAQAALQIFG